MAPLIDPASITTENIPAILGAMLIELRDIRTEQKDQRKILEEHSDCLELFKFSRCKLIPWIGRNRWVVAAVFTMVTLWFSSLDWINQYLQWAFFPPIKGP